jgi:hypothetical protein
LEEREMAPFRLLRRSFSLMKCGFGPLQKATRRSTSGAALEDEQTRFSSLSEVFPIACTNSWSGDGY